MDTDGLVWTVLIIVIAIGVTTNGITEKYFAHVEKLASCEMKK